MRRRYILFQLPFPPLSLLLLFLLLLLCVFRFLRLFFLLHLLGRLLLSLPPISRLLPPIFRSTVASSFSSSWSQRPLNWPNLFLALPHWGRLDSLLFLYTPHWPIAWNSLNCLINKCVILVNWSHWKKRKRTADLIWGTAVATNTRKNAAFAPLIMWFLLLGGDYSPRGKWSIRSLQVRNFGVDGKKKRSWNHCWCLL